MSDEPDSEDSWASKFAIGGAIIGGMITWKALEFVLEPENATAAQAGGVGAVSVGLGVLIGGPIGSLTGWLVGKLLDKLNLRF